ncbi:hypothetical protein OH809_12610 [Streptomyces sp. NBC_00873]|uniref:hypothetical protein n=1 Tax=unclassified Streptomyces TaxID=2593676 RepID=UPI00386BE525|nr:hypothetical protein OH809_12610 [Streptomyces sp. NBC_00873]WTA46538.1 hypothetical protein OH821_31195 [Streptomyces sp. NBC_00842]
MRRTGTTRRGALTVTGAIALGAALSGCGDGDSGEGRKGSAPAGAREAAAEAESTLRMTAARTSGTLLARYEQVVTAHPATAAGLAPLRDAVRAHTEALSPGADRTARPGAGETAGTTAMRGADRAPAVSGPPAPSGSPTVSGSPPADAKTAVKELAASERRTADAHTATLLTAPPELARLLASIAAAGAAHAYLLTELAKETSS